MSQTLKRYGDPAFDARLAEAITPTDVAAANAQDHHWRWREKTQLRQGRLDWKSFAIECDSSTQGLMFVHNLGICTGTKSEESTYYLY